MAGGVGALAWGGCARFLSRALLLSLVRGGLIGLPWVLMVDVLPGRHFAKLALAVTWVGLVVSSLGPLCWGSALAVWGIGAFLWIALVESPVLVAVVGLRPRLFATDRR